MSTPADERPILDFQGENTSSTGPRSRLNIDTTLSEQDGPPPTRTLSSRREQATRLEDDLMLLQAERVVSHSTQGGDAERGGHNHLGRARSRRNETVDEFDEATNPLHEKAAAYKPPESPNTKLAAFVKKIHQSSFLVRYLTYIVPMVLILLIPLLVGALKYPEASVGGVRLMWFSIWLEIVWLSLWAGRIVGRFLPLAMGVLASIFTNNAKKWRDLGKQLEVHLALFLWSLAMEISFLPTMQNHPVRGNTSSQSWEETVNKIIVTFLVWTVLNLIEKFIIQLIAISFHQRTYADRIEVNKFQIGSLTKLYKYSRALIEEEDEAFEEGTNEQTPMSNSTPTPLQYATKARRVTQRAVSKVGIKVSDVAGGVVADFTGREVKGSNDYHQVVLTLLRSISGSQVLARRLYRTFVRDGFDTISSGDLKSAFDNNEEAEAAFTMFDRDINGDISMEELEAVCVDIGRDRKSITASLKDLDSVVSKLDEAFMLFVFIITLIVLLSLISTSTAGVLTSAGATVLALSWMFSTTATEFLQSTIFVFVKHPFDVGDRVTIYGFTGDTGLGDDYFVKEITLLYTEFKKMQGHVVQAPNSYLNTLFILNQRRSGALAEAVPIIIKYGTTIDQLDSLRLRLLEFVRSEKRDFQSNILTELRQVTENLSLTLNVVFFYKSNWQNEGLRLQRRNKFICMLMVALQEIGIEGPRMNLQGYKTDIPMYISHVNQATMPPNYSKYEESRDGAPVDKDLHPNPNNSGTTNRSDTRHPSILRRGKDSTAGQASHKHVDFSLGMSGISSNDVMGDVFEDRDARIDDVVRTANRESAERQTQETTEGDEHRSHSSSRQLRHSTEATSVRSGTSSHRDHFHHRHNANYAPGDLESGRGVSPSAPVAAGAQYGRSQ